MSSQSLFHQVNGSFLLVLRIKNLMELKLSQSLFHQVNGSFGGKQAW